MTSVASFTDVYSDALRGNPCSVSGIYPDVRRLPVHTWLRAADDSDQVLLDHCRGTTVDIGCGPGRMSAHLAASGHMVLAVDLVREAVEQARRRGVPAVRRNVFDPLPGEGNWDTVLLADGNIGIGGEPVALLRRSAELLGQRGRIVCDLAPHGTGVQMRNARLVSEGKESSVFRWAQVGADAIHATASSAGLLVESVHEYDDRWFAVLTR